MNSRKRKYNRFPVGRFQALQRQKRHSHQSIKLAEMKLKDKNKELHLKQQQLQRVDEKVS